MTRNEQETRTQLIYPALQKQGWPQADIREEQTAGAIYKDGRKYRRSKPRVDYLLRIRVSDNTPLFPIGVIEAKREGEHPMMGLEQAKRYAARLNVPFVYATNGHRFIEYDDFTGQTTYALPMSEFPTPGELRRRYEKRKGFSLIDTTARPLLTPYTKGGDDRRYYQDAAIRAALEKIAAGGNRILLTLATGAGKTFLAVHLLKRLVDAGQLKKALFVCDRTELRDQATTAFQNVFGANAQPVNSQNARKNARILIATYQTLGVDDPDDEEDDEASFLLQNYPENYFSHIIIDECHRSAWGKWSRVLTHNSKAVQIGLTATPRQLTTTPQKSVGDALLATTIQQAITQNNKITADNLAYFGEPVYEYTLTQGNEDGYLAVAEVIEQLVNIDPSGLSIAEVLSRNPVDVKTGKRVREEALQDIYLRTSYEDRIQLPDRVDAMCQDLFRHLLDTGGPHQKTIIFCVRDTHARTVAERLNALYRTWCEANGLRLKANYAFICTESADGNAQLPDFKSSRQSHFIATTVELLTTGVDVPDARNIVFFRYLRSPIAFYQMVGRGTRLTADKLFFRIYDYTDVIGLFGLPFISRPRSVPKLTGSDRGDLDLPEGGEEEIERPDPVTIEVKGFDVQVSHRGRYIIDDVDGQPTPVPWEEYKRRIAQCVQERAPNVDAFRQIWIDFQARQQLMQALPRQGQSVRLVQDLDDLDEYDLYDVLSQLAYNQQPRTRIERVTAFNRMQAAWLGMLGQQPAELICAFVEQFAADGTEALESNEIWNTPDVLKAGGYMTFSQIKQSGEIFRQIKQKIFFI